MSKKVARPGVWPTSMTKLAAPMLTAAQARHPLPPLTFEAIANAERHPRRRGGRRFRGIGLARNLCTNAVTRTHSHDPRAGICVSCLEFNPSPNFNGRIRRYFEPIDWMGGVSGHKSK